MPAVFPHYLPCIAGFVLYELASDLLTCTSVSQGLGTCCSRQNLGTFLDFFVLRRNLLQLSVTHLIYFLLATYHAEH